MLFAYKSDSHDSIPSGFSCHQMMSPCVVPCQQDVFLNYIKLNLHDSISFKIGKKSNNMFEKGDWQHDLNQGFVEIRSTLIHSQLCCNVY